MSLTAAERKRKSRERQKEEEKKKPDGTHAFLKQPFFEWMGGGEDTYGRWQEITFPLGLVGLQLEPFEDDSGATATTAEFDPWGTDEGYYDQYPGSVGRTELMISCLLDTAGQLAWQLNQYKLEQIDLAIAGLENADLSDPAIRKRALADIVKLNKFHERLKRQRRFSLPEWTVKSD
jgi:hypothetical protein